MWAFLFGALCVLCRQRVSGADAQRRQLCCYCLADLPWLALPEGEPSRGGPIRRQITPLRYEGAPRGWVLEAKRANGLIAARVLGVLLAETLQDAYPAGVRRPDLLVPVPLSLPRLLRRGHNQAALIGEPVSRMLDIPLDRRVVRRRRHSAIQPGLSQAQRRANVADLFECRRDLAGISVALVDDVVTTGATAEALARVLLEAGAADVHLWCPTGAHGAATLAPLP